MEVLWGNGRGKTGKENKKGWSCVTKLLVCPCARPPQPVLSSHQTPFLATFLGTGALCAWACVEV